MFSIKRVILIVFVLVFILILAGCRKESKSLEEEQIEEILPDTGEIREEENVRDTIIYYQDDYGYLIPVMRKILWEEGIAKAALRKLMDTPEQQHELATMGLKALLPANTQIRGLSIDDNGLARLDLNKEVLDFEDAVAESNMIQGVVMTLTEFPSIERVQFLFDGEPVDTLKFGTKLGEMPVEPKDINLEIGLNTVDAGAKVTVFFPGNSLGRFDYIVPVTRITSDPIATVESAISELLRGPKSETPLSLDIPEGTELIGVQMDSGITYINFSKEFDSLRESSVLNESKVLKCIAMTAAQFPEVEEVRILVDGREYKNAGLVSIPVFANEY